MEAMEPGHHPTQTILEPVYNQTGTWQIGWFESRIGWRFTLRKNRALTLTCLGSFWL